MPRVSYAGMVGDEVCREGWGKKGEEGGSPCVELAFEVKFHLHETKEMSFASDFYVCLIPLNSSEYCYDTGIKSTESLL